MLRRAPLASVALAASSLIAGCGNLVIHATVQEAVDKDDAALLERVCLREVGTIAAEDQPLACRKSVELAKKRSDSAYLKKVCAQEKLEDACSVVKADETAGALAAALDSGDCGKIAAVSKGEGGLSVKYGDDTNQLKLLVGLAKCGNAELLFEREAHSGDMGPQAKIVKQLHAADEATGGAVFKAFQSYAASHAGASFLNAEHGAFAANHVANWMTKHHKDQCKLMQTALTGARDLVAANALLYFTDNGCTEATPIMTKVLASDDPNARVLACNNLALVSDKDAAKKVKIVADTDAYSVVEEHDGRPVKVFPVRELCLQAHGKMLLRAK